MGNIKIPIFTPDELTENEARKQKLEELILSEQAVLVVGAGSSVELGYPTWTQLLDKLEQLAESCGNNFQRNDDEKKYDPLGYVDKIMEHIEKKQGNLNKYKKEITSLFSPSRASSPFNEFHVNLVGLPFKGILTTNYDTVLESALRANSNKDYGVISPLIVDEAMPVPVSDFFFSLDSIQLPKRVLHLHGYHERPDSIILSQKDYIKSYGLKPKDGSKGFEESNPSWSLQRKVLWSILATRLSVWIGFSMKDPYLNKMLEMVSDDLWRWDETIHFGIMSINYEDAHEIKEKAKLFKRNYGMGVVFYESTEEDHSALKQIIERFYELYKRKQNQSEKFKSGKEQDARIKDQLPVAPRIVDKKDSSEWLDRVNKSMEERIKLHGY
jgi:hypothetical protein